MEENNIIESIELLASLDTYHPNDHKLSVAIVDFLTSHFPTLFEKKFCGSQSFMNVVIIKDDDAYRVLKSFLPNYFILDSKLTYMTYTNHDYSYKMREVSFHAVQGNI